MVFNHKITGQSLIPNVYTMQSTVGDTEIKKTRPSKCLQSSINLREKTQL